MESDIAVMSDDELVHHALTERGALNALELELVIRVQRLMEEKEDARYEVSAATARAEAYGDT